MINRSRAAILCLGGWGLQTMLHLGPRLRFIQEERQTLGIAKELPDLNQLTAFATVFPDLRINTIGTLTATLQVVRPALDAWPEPFYVEQVARTFRNYQAEQGSLLNPTLTASEQWGQYLFEDASRSNHVQTIALRGIDDIDNLDGVRPTRYEMFGSAIRRAEVIARAILREVIEPTRLDYVQTRDTFVKTTFYIVASLAEPLTSTLIWPLISELKAIMGPRHIVNIVGFFMTSSFANDDSYSFEEAAVYTALQELETLTGIPHKVPDSVYTKVAPNGTINGNNSGEGSRITSFQTVVQRFGGSGWARRVGQSMFYRIYLLDREKSNQALARDPMELSILAGNVIEGFLAADGAVYLESQLDADVYSHQYLPYSLIGSANDYVPLAAYMIAAVTEEQKRIIREEILKESDIENAPPATLKDLRVEPHRAVEALLRPSTRRIFDTLVDQRSWWQRIRHSFQRQRSVPSSVLLPHLRVAKSYLLSNTRHWRQIPHLWEWRRTADLHFTHRREELERELGQTYLEDNWGVSMRPPQWSQTEVPDGILSPEQLELYLQPFQLGTWSERHQRDSRVLPQAVFIALARVVKTIAGTPNGLQKSRYLLEQWAEHAEQTPEILKRMTPSEHEQVETEYGQRFRSWNEQFVRISGRRPHYAAIIVRAVLAVLLAGYLEFAFLFLETDWVLSRLQWISAALLPVLVGLLVGLLPIMLYRWDTNRIKSKRILLAQERLSLDATVTVHDAVSDIYRVLHTQLMTMLGTVRRTLSHLTNLAEPDEPIHIPSRGIVSTHLRIPQTDEAVWAYMREMVQAERAPDGRSGQDIFRQEWLKEGQIERGWMARGSRLQQRLRLDIEYELNEYELTRIIRPFIDAHTPTSAIPTPPSSNAKRKQRPQPPPPLYSSEAIQQGQWCPFRTSTPVAQPLDESGCTACPLHQTQACVFTRQGNDRRPNWSYHSIVEEATRNATEHIIFRKRSIPDRRDLITQLTSEFGIEKLLIKAFGGSRLTSEKLNEAVHAFVEESFARAKPSANYDATTNLRTPVLETNFAMVPTISTSRFAGFFESRRIIPLASHDPTALTTVRTLHYLALDDLILTERGRSEFQRLYYGDRDLLTILKEDAEFYSTIPDDTVAYDPYIAGS